jgi:hypothetical protein
MKKTITLQMFSDPGHGWVRFPRSRLVRLGIADKISPYSYQRGDQVFLEEDCDLTVLITALRAQGYADTDIQFRGGASNRRSKIRGYEHYSVK